MIVKNWGETPEQDTEVKVEMDGKIHVVEICVNKEGFVDIYLLEDENRNERKRVTTSSARHSLSIVDVIVKNEGEFSNVYYALYAKDIVNTSVTDVKGEDGMGFWCSLSQEVLTQYVEEKHEPKLAVYEYQASLEINDNSDDDGVDEDDTFTIENVYVYSPSAELAAGLVAWEEKKGKYEHLTSGRSTHIIDVMEEDIVTE